MADYSKYIHRISVPDPHAQRPLGDRTAFDFNATDDGDSSVNTFGKLIRRVASTHRDALDHYLRLHDESDEERDHGGLLDFGSNIVTAMKRGNKNLQRSIRISDVNKD